MVAKIHDDGLSVLHDPENPLADIIFVHGLQGHPRGTWTSAGLPTPPPAVKKGGLKQMFQIKKKSRETETEVFWPEDLLPLDFPRARILTYGYESRISRGLGGPANKDSFNDHARNMLYELDHDRLNHEDRRLIFVAHSLGGIIAKTVVYDASVEILSIFESTRAVLFLGTPHRGSALASTADIIRGIAAVVGFDTSDRNLRALQLNSQVLSNCHRNFMSLYNRPGRRFQVRSFREAQGMTGVAVAGLNNKVVDDFSSSLDGPDDRPQTINANHMSMCRFSSRDDDGYRKVSRELRAIMSDIQKEVEEEQLRKETQAELVNKEEGSDEEGHAELPGTEPKLTQFTMGEQECLQSLYFPEMNLRRYNITTASAGTCAWLLKHRAYSNWLEQRGFLWIEGKPGAGKSTLMKYALRSIEQQEFNEDSPAVASYFFHGGGTDLQKTLLGLFRSLLHQLLPQLPPLRSKFQKIFEANQKMRGDVGKNWQWHTEELQDFFLSAVPLIADSHPIIIFVDALDEGGEQVAEELVSFFRDLVVPPPAGKYSFSICFSCRHFPVLALDDGLKICVDDENQPGISSYVRDRLLPCTGIYEDIGRDIVQRASGVFQWVYLVTQIAVKLYRNGESLKAIQERVREAPAHLYGIYQQILGGIDEARRFKAQYLLQWICFARKPLSLTELRFAMAINADSPFRSLREWKDSKDYVEDEGMEKLVNSLSGGLAEVKIRDNISIAQFIHQSVNDYLIQGGFQILNPDLTVSAVGYGQHQLARSCVKYFAMEEILHWSCKAIGICKTEKEFPLLEYAVEYWGSHAQEAEANNIPQGDLLSSPEWPSDAVFLCWIPTRLSPLEKTHILHAASRYGLLSVIIAIFKIEPNMVADSKDPNRRTPLSLAAEGGHLEVVNLLVEKNNIDINSRDKYGKTPLSWAAKEGHVEVVRLLIKRDDIDIFSAECSGETSLSDAAYWGHLEVVKLLVEKGGSDIINYRGRQPGRALLNAAWHGHLEIVKLLVEKFGINEGSEGKQHQLPLVWAARDGHLEVVKLLVAHIDVNSTDEMGQTALLLAAQGGHLGIVRLLVRRDDVNVNSKNNKGQTPLLWAAQEGHLDIVRLLIRRDDIHVNCRDKEDQTPLLRAAQGGHLEIIRLLAKKGDIDIESKDKLGRTPLSYAAGNGHPEVAELLVQKYSVNIDSKDSGGRTPLFWAVIGGHLEVVRLIAGKTGDTEAKDSESRTLLLWAAIKGHLEVLRLLAKERGIKIDFEDSKDSDGQTPLSCAARKDPLDIAKVLIEKDSIYMDLKDEKGSTLLSHASMMGSPEIVKLLVENNSFDINAKNLKGVTPLFWAAERGHLEVTKLLIEKGADIDAKHKFGLAPLSSAAEFGHLEVVRLLVEKGAAIDTTDVIRQTPLSIAAENGHLEVTQLLIEMGAAIDHMDKGGRTPLSAAAVMGKLEVVKLLAEKGADVDARSESGKTPLSFAFEQGRPEIVEFLREMGAVDTGSKS